MQVFLEAIKFNHHPTSANADAFNIRKNEIETVPFPEWTRETNFNDKDSVAAYAIKPTLGQTLSIQAKFKCSDLSLSTISVQAVDASSPFATGNILGTVEKGNVTFGGNGESDFVPFNLKDVRLGERGVGLTKNIWRWQFHLPSTNDWTDFATTTHNIYSVLDEPQPPWDQESKYDNTQLPWTEVLDVACDWAKGAKTVEQAAELITRKVYDLGKRTVGYCGSPATYAMTTSFNCTDLLDLLHGGVGMGKFFNCSDCATIVSTFANILGCKTFQVEFFPGFSTNPIILIGGSKPDGDHFEGHEVAWTGASPQQGVVCDACLQVDGDDNPKDSSHFEALLPTNLPFDQHYRFRVDSTNKIEPILPGQLRTIGSAVEANVIEPDPKSLKALAERYRYPEWKDLPYSETARWTGLSKTRLGLHQILNKEKERTQTFVDRTQLKQTLFRVSDTDALIREDVFECRDAHAARELLLRLLGQYKSTKVERLEHAVFADVAFLATNGASALFAVSRSVVFISSDSGGETPVRESELQLGDS